MKLVFTLILFLTLTSANSQIEMPLFSTLEYFTNNRISEIRVFPDSIEKHDFLHVKFNPIDSTLQWHMRNREKGKSMPIDSKMKFDTTGFLFYVDQHKNDFKRDSMGNILEAYNSTYEYDSLNNVLKISDMSSQTEFVYNKNGTLSYSFYRRLKYPIRLDSEVVMLTRLKEYFYIGDFLFEESIYERQFNFQTCKTIRYNSDWRGLLNKTIHIRNDAVFDSYSYHYSFYE